MATYGYVRVSTGQQAEGESLDVQRRVLEGWALMRGVPLDEVFVEAGVSGSIDLADRPQGARLLASVRRGDVVATPKLDRLFRSALDCLGVVKRFDDRNVELHLLDIGNISGGVGRMFLTICAGFAEFERDRIRERITASKRDQRERGRYMGGPVPIGFRKTIDGNSLEPDPDQAEAVAMMKALRRDGASLRQIVAKVHALTGLRVSVGSVRAIVGAVL